MDVETLFEKLEFGGLNTAPLALHWDKVAELHQQHCALDAPKSGAELAALRLQVQRDLELFGEGGAPYQQSKKALEDVLRRNQQLRMQNDRLIAAEAEARLHAIRATRKAVLEVYRSCADQIGSMVAGAAGATRPKSQSLPVEIKAVFRRGNWAGRILMDPILSVPPEDPSMVDATFLHALPERWRKAVHKHCAA
jgi:hypothetical protein